MKENNIEFDGKYILLKWDKETYIKLWPKGYAIYKERVAGRVSYFTAIYPLEDAIRIFKQEL